jgi:hypothetical protein
MSINPTARALAETGGIRGTGFAALLDKGGRADAVVAGRGEMDVDSDDALGDVGGGEAGSCEAEPDVQPAQAATRSSAPIPRRNTAMGPSSLTESNGGGFGVGPGLAGPHCNG